MKVLKSLCLFSLLGMTGIFSVLAQSGNNQETLPLVQNDPIVEMLDSLVTLNHVIRYNNLNSQGPGVTSKTDLPYYSDEI